MSIEWKEYMRKFSWHSTIFRSRSQTKHKFIICKSLADKKYHLTLLKYASGYFSYRDMGSYANLTDCKQKASLIFRKLTQGKLENAA